jgi:excisionase family DNA binding protein
VFPVAHLLTVVYTPGELAELLTIPEVSKFLRVSPATVRRLIARGEMPFVQIGRRYLFRSSDLEELVRTKRREPKN